MPALGKTMSQIMAMDRRRPIDAIRIDIAMELAARERGECLLCRIKATHTKVDACAKTPAFKGLATCSCGCVYDPLLFKTCPDHKEAP